MEQKIKITKHYSRTLMYQNVRSTWGLALAAAIISMMLSVIISFAMSMMDQTMIDVETQEAQEDFYVYLYVLQAAKEATGQNLDYYTYQATPDKSIYQEAFDQASELAGRELTVEQLNRDIEILKDSGVSMDVYLKEFEYAYSLMGSTGILSGEELSLEGFLTVLFQTMNMDEEQMTAMMTMDPVAFMSRIYYCNIIVLPLFLFVVIVANNLLVSQVDSGSLAYVLSTPTRRSAVVSTIVLYLILMPALLIGIAMVTNLAAGFFFFRAGDFSAKTVIAEHIGLYVLVEAIAGICYFASCLFNQNRRSLAVGGGFTAWCYLNSLIGIFGSKEMVDMKMGVKQLDFFNKVTLNGLLDIAGIQTLATDSPSYDFLWKLGILALIAAVCYIAGSEIFKKKDLPL